jgi:lactate dehydrogenase-like 2-hydroxyacid dehydrogenase
MKGVDRQAINPEGKNRGPLPIPFRDELLHRKTVVIVGTCRIGFGWARMMDRACQMNVACNDTHCKKPAYPK